MWIESNIKVASRGFCRGNFWNSLNKNQGGCITNNKRGVVLGLVLGGWIHKLMRNRGKFVSIPEEGKSTNKSIQEKKSMINGKN